MNNNLCNVGIIPDGNRRWAVKNDIDFLEVYNKSLKRVFELAELCESLDIGHMCFYGMSSDNYTKRQSPMIDAVVELFCMYLEDFLRRNKSIFRAKIYGDMIPNKSLRNIISETESATDFIHEISFLVNYSVDWDLITYPDFRSKLIPEMDLVIRTGGYKRLSGFLPVQSRYANLIFSDKEFPDYGLDDLRKDVISSRSLERRFGA